MANIPDVNDSRLPEPQTSKEVEAARQLSAERRVGKSNATAGERDLRDAETFRALHGSKKE